MPDLLRWRLEKMARKWAAEARNLLLALDNPTVTYSDEARIWTRAAALRSAAAQLRRQLDTTKPPTLAGRVWAKLCRRIWRGKGS